MRTVNATDGPSALILSVLVFLVCVGCAGDGARGPEAYNRKIQRTEQLLIVAGDADSLAAAALLSIGPAGDPEQRLTLIARAVDLAPDRPDLVWLNLRFCIQIESCNREPLETRLRVLDSANGIAWSDSIARAGKRNDIAAARTDLMAIAASTRFDTYWNATIVRTTNAILETRTMSLHDAFLTTIGMASAMAIPAYHPIVNACGSEALRDPVVVDTCRRVATVMRRGDTYITEMIGVAIAKRAWPEGSTEYLDAVRAQRVARYRMDTYGKFARHHLWSSRFAARRLQWMSQKRTEQEVVLAEIMDANLNPNPPSDWADKSP